MNGHKAAYQRLNPYEYADILMDFEESLTTLNVEQDISDVA